jgi:hypothetical protein
VGVYSLYPHIHTGCGIVLLACICSCGVLATVGRCDRFPWTAVSLPGDTGPWTGTCESRHADLYIPNVHPPLHMCRAGLLVGPLPLLRLHPCSDWPSATIGQRTKCCSGCVSTHCWPRVLVQGSCAHTTPKVSSGVVCSGQYVDRLLWLLLLVSSAAPACA